MAVEMRELHGHVTCSGCSPKQRAEQGCKAHGHDIERTASPHRWYSPRLQGRDHWLNECPTGYLLRTAPWVWSMIESAGMLEGMNPALWSDSPRALRAGARIYQGELRRLREVKRAREKGKSASRYGERVRAGRG